MGEGEKEGKLVIMRCKKISFCIQNTEIEPTIINKNEFKSGQIICQNSKKNGWQQYQEVPHISP